MAKTKESSFRDGIHRHLSKDIHKQSMYTPYAAGTPDNLYIYNDGLLFIEYKWLSKLPRVIHLTNPDVKKPMLSKHQSSWLNMAIDFGVDVAVVLGSPEGGYVFTRSTWDTQLNREVFLAMAQTKEEIARWITSRVDHSVTTKLKRQIIPR